MKWLTMAWDSHRTAILAGLFAALGALCTHLWQRFRSRITVLRWLARHERIASTGADATLGTVAVTHNDVPVENVFLSSVEMENTSQRDLADLEVHMAHTDGFTFLGGSGRVVGSIRTLDFSGRFVGEIERVLAIAADAPEHGPGWTYIQTHREYRVPVLNRGAKLVFVHTVTGPRDVQPFVAVSCEHLSARTIMEGPRSMTYGVPTAHALAVGTVIGAALTEALAVFTHRLWIAAFGGLVIGGFLTLLGVAGVRLIRFVGRMLS